MNRRSFLRLFLATTGACVMGGNKLYNDTSHDASTSLSKIAPMTSDEQALWVFAQQLYDFAYYCASMYQAPMTFLFGKELTVQDYYASLLEEYRKLNKLPAAIEDCKLEYMYRGEVPQTLELKARFV